jgi:hypothetical protein
MTKIKTDVSFNHRIKTMLLENLYSRIVTYFIKNAKPIFSYLDNIIVCNVVDSKHLLSGFERVLDTGKTCKKFLLRPTTQLFVFRSLTFSNRENGTFKSRVADPDPYWESGSRGKKIKKFQWKKCTF